jgi:flagellar hook-associated protein 3 FlgL
VAISRIGNLALFKSGTRNIGEVQANLAKLQQQISSGNKSSDFRGLNGQVEQFTFLESRIRQVTLYQENNAIAVARLQTADQALTQATSTVDDIENLMIQRRNGATSQTLDFELQLKNMTKSLANELNITFEGRFLFGGTNTADLPVPDPFVPQATPGVPDDGYYKGSKEYVSFRADDRIEFQFAARADDPAFQRIFAAVNTAISAHRVNDDAQLKVALDAVQQGQDELITLRSRVNSDRVIVEQINERHSSLELYWKGVTEQVSKTDVVAASVELARNEAILQAGFQAFARLSQLKLSDYLN